jgi:hypothetical protein
MVELAEQVGMIAERDRLALPTGVIVGSAVIEKVVSLHNSEFGIQNSEMYAWHLTDVERATTLRKPKGHPQPVWFKAF